MQFTTPVAIPRLSCQIKPEDTILLVGSCFTTEIGNKFIENGFNATINPYGTMYNPVSILHSIENTDMAPDVCFISLGTNHVYRDVATGKIVDNCQKRPQDQFHEEELGIDECNESLRTAIAILRKRNHKVKVILTVSPIRYRKYGYHQSQLSKAVLLLATDLLVKTEDDEYIEYFPAYEILMDELRDYRFYQMDMLHPSAQAVDYIWEKLSESCFPKETVTFIEKWRPLYAAMAHKPFKEDSPDYQAFRATTLLRIKSLAEEYPHLSRFLDSYSQNP